MKKNIKDLTIEQMVSKCDNCCGDCELWNLCECLDWHIFTLAYEKTDILDQEIEVEEDE